jgi:hypothetical protein
MCRQRRLGVLPFSRNVITFPTLPPLNHGLRNVEKLVAIILIFSIAIDSRQRPITLPTCLA